MAGRRIGVVVGIYVEMIGVSSSRQGNVQCFTGGGGARERVRGINGAPLSTMRRRRVGEFDVLGDVTGRQDDRAASTQPGDSH